MSLGLGKSITRDHRLCPRGPNLQKPVSKRSIRSAVHTSENHCQCGILTTWQEMVEVHNIVYRLIDVYSLIVCFLLRIQTPWSKVIGSDMYRPGLVLCHPWLLGGGGMQVYNWLCCITLQRKICRMKIRKCAFGVNLQMHRETMTRLQMHL